MTKISVHKFRLADCEDPDLVAAENLWRWENSEQGRFVMKNSVDVPIWHKTIDKDRCGWQFNIVADLPDTAITEFYLRWAS